jgi:uncharacterized protein DUF5681
MSKKKDAAPKSPNAYDVGYGKPPVTTRFKPGQSGNPRGRPKGIKSLNSILQEALLTRLTVNGQGGRTRKVRAQDLIIRGLVTDAARIDHSAIKLLFALMDRYADGHPNSLDTSAMSPDDRAIIEGYLQSINGTGPEEAAQELKDPEPEAEPERKSSNRGGS